MAKKKEKSVKRTTVTVPKSIEEVSESIAKIGALQRKSTEIQLHFNNQIERIKEKVVADGLAFQKRIDKLFDGIYIFAESHRDELTEKGKKKTVSLPTGDILWRLNPPAVSIRDAKKIIPLCKSLGLERFIRIKEELDKKAMLNEPEVAGKIKGVTIKQDEEFVVKPSEIQIEISRDTKKLQKVLSKK